MNDNESCSYSGGVFLHLTQSKPFRLKLPDNSPSTCSDTTAESCSENFVYNPHSFKKDNSDILNSEADLITQSLYDDFNKLQLRIFQLCQESKVKKISPFYAGLQSFSSVNIQKYSPNSFIKTEP